MAPPVTVVVRGTGSIGSRHLEVLRGLGCTALACPVRPESQADVRSMREAAERGATHAVIATATGRHLDDAREALEAGLHVLVEKPLSPTAAGVAELTRLAERSGRQVHVAYCLRFDEALTIFRRQLPKIGAVHHVAIACQSFLPSWRPGRDYRTSYSADAREGGVLRDLSHEIDYATWLFGSPAGAVFALLGSTNRLEIAAEETADLTWHVAGGAVVRVHLDYVTRHARRTMLAQGADGEIEWDAIANTVRLRGEAEDEVVQIAPDRNAMMRAQARAFLAEDDAAKADLCTLAEGLAVVELCEAARAFSPR